MSRWILGLLGVCLAGCATPCEKLADEVCAKMNDPQQCEEYRARLKKLPEAQHEACTKKRALIADCEKLADDVCAKLNDPRLCEEYRTKLRNAPDAQQADCPQKRILATEIARDTRKADDIRRYMKNNPMVKKIFGGLRRPQADGGMQLGPNGPSGSSAPAAPAVAPVAPVGSPSTAAEPRR